MVLGSSSSSWGDAGPSWDCSTSLCSLGFSICANGFEIIEGELLRSKDTPFFEVHQWLRSKDIQEGILCSWLLTCSKLTLKVLGTCTLRVVLAWILIKISTNKYCEYCEWLHKNGRRLIVYQYNHLLMMYLNNS